MKKSKRPKQTESQRLELSQSFENDIRAVFERHNAGGLVIVVTADLAGWRPILPASTGIRFEPDGKLHGTLNPLDEVGSTRLLRFLGMLVHMGTEGVDMMSRVLADIERTLGYTYEFEEEL